MTGETDAMTLTGFLFWISFIFCLALTAGGVMLIFRFKNLKVLPAFPYLQYYMILIYTFGFYVLWTELFLMYLPLKPEIAGFSNLVIVLGTPFLLIAAILQLLVVQNLLFTKPNRLFLPAVLLIDAAVVCIFLYKSDFLVLEHAKGIYAISGSLFAICAAILLAGFSITLFSARYKWLLAGILMCMGILYMVPIFFNSEDIFANLVLVFLFFLLNTVFCILFVYKIELKPAPARVLNSFDGFVKKYGITNRESEIIQEIYEGKSNQQIADRLFVTLQTVKDHTSRIYQKTDVKSRAQLVTLIRDFGLM